MTVSRLQGLPIRTPEGIEFSLPLAGPVSRLMAVTVDVIVVSAAGLAIDKIMAPFGVISQDAAGAFQILLYFAVSMLYGILCEWLLRGQTLGKRIFKLRVVDAAGLRLEPSQVIIRNLLRAIDVLPVCYLLGGIVCLLNKRMQRLGDIAAGTAVVRVPDATNPDLDQVLGGKFNSMLEYRMLCARLRQRVTPSMAGLSLQALMRREQLDASSRLAVFRDLAEHFKSLVAFPPEAVEHLADEQYVRNVVEILYRR